jgi:hypothetical protein
MKTFVTLIFTLNSIFVYSNRDYKIETSDIANFGKANELLSTANNRQDSINIIQNQYIEKASIFFRCNNYLVTNENWR